MTLYHCSPTPGLKVLRPSVTQYFGKPRQVQKVLFLQEKSYTERSCRIREILWCLLPGCLTAAAGGLGNWFPEAEGKTSLWFYGIMFCYFILLWLFLKKFYREETEEMNELLNRRKQKKIWREKSD